MIERHHRLPFAIGALEGQQHHAAGRHALCPGSEHATDQVGDDVDQAEPGQNALERNLLIGQLR